MATNSPHLNPIETLWSYLHGKIVEKEFKDLTEFIAAICQKADATPLSYLCYLVGSMGKRMKECISNEGGKPKY